MDIKIREATSADLPAILELYAQLSSGEDYPLEEAQELFNRIRSQDRHYIYVATTEGLVVGTFALLIMDNLAHRGAPSGIVEDVVVHPDWQGKGIGRKMMNFAFTQCKKAGCYKMALSSNINREAAHRFYDSLGFQRHGFSFFVK